MEPIRKAKRKTDLMKVSWALSNVHKSLFRFRFSTSYRRDENSFLLSLRSVSAIPIWKRRAFGLCERERRVQITEINIPNQLIRVPFRWGGWKKRNSINSKSISFWGQVWAPKKEKKNIKKCRRNWKCSLSVGMTRDTETEINPIKNRRIGDFDELELGVRDVALHRKWN